MSLGFTNAERVSGGWAVTTLKDNVRDCGYNFEGDCTNEDLGFYGLECPFKTFCECPVHNEKL